MKSFLRATLIWAAIALGGATLVVGFGLYDVSARRGHLPGVSWVLHTTFRNSVRLRAPSQDEVPDLTDPDLIHLGSNHYASACSFCHGLPDKPRSETARAMVPPPPPIADAVAHWQPNHLFWIVQHGVKMTGMPAWPSDRRDDEVWSVVAYLNAVKSEGGERPAISQTSEEPRRESKRNAVQACARCHGEDGRGDGNGHIPRLDILDPAYIAASLQAYRDGVRFSGIMQHAVSHLSDAAIPELAKSFAGPRRGSGGSRQTSTSDWDIEQGRALAAGRDEKRNIPACRACHGPWSGPRPRLAPSLAGQRKEYLTTQMRLWKAGKRGGTRAAHLMHLMTVDLDDAQMRALAAYYAALPPP